MFGFLKRNKKDINPSSLTSPLNLESEKEEPKKPGYIYQSQDYMGVKPEYFNRDKIKLNKFLTDDEEYRKKVDFENTYCSQHGMKIMSSRSCHNSRYEKDNKALQEIENVLNSKNDLNSFEYLYKAQKLHKVNKHNKMIDEMHDLEKSNNADDNHFDKRGLSANDYNVIVNNMNEQIANISAATKRLLKDQKTKVLNLTTHRLTDDDINPNIVTKFYDSRSKKLGLDAIVDVKNPIEGLELDNSITKEYLFDHANMLMAENAELLNAQTQHNANITQHNFDTIMNTRSFTDNHARLKDVPPIEIEKFVDDSEDVINLDELTPYNVVKTDMRIRKSDKRNINF